jgi:hypothetical protein
VVSEPSKNFQNRRVLGIPFVSRFPRVCGSPERLCNFLDIMQTCPFVKSGGDETTPKLKLRDLHRNEEMDGLIAVSTRPRVSPTRFMWSSSYKLVRGSGGGRVLSPFRTKLSHRRFSILSVALYRRRKTHGYDRQILIFTIVRKKYSLP